jgi:hypothetical protein
MADCDVVLAHENLVYQQPYDSLPLWHFQEFASGVQPCAELGKSFDQAKIPRLIDSHHLQ